MGARLTWCRIGGPFYHYQGIASEMEPFLHLISSRGTQGALCLSLEALGLESERSCLLGNRTALVDPDSGSETKVSMQALRNIQLKTYLEEFSSVIITVVNSN